MSNVKEQLLDTKERIRTILENIPEPSVRETVRTNLEEAIWDIEKAQRRLRIQAIRRGEQPRKEQ